MPDDHEGRTGISDGTKSLPPRVAPEDDPVGLVSRVDERLDELAQRFDKTDWIELLAAVLLAFATIVAAWSAYQSTRWSGEQATAANRAIALRTQATEATTINAAGTEIDAEFVTAWLILAAEGNTVAMGVIEDRMRDDLRPAFDAWLDLAPDGEIPPGTPFDLPTYEFYALDHERRALELDLEASGQTIKAGEANQTGDNFVLVVVIMASVLFFAGVGSKFRSRGVRLLMILLAAAFFLVDSHSCSAFPRTSASVRFSDRE